MSDKVKLRVYSSNKSKCLIKLNNLNINMECINYTNEYLEFITRKENIKRIKKYLPSFKIEVVNELGISKIKNNIKANSLFLVGLIFAILMFLFLSNIIVKVNIIHEDKEIRDILEYSLNIRGVTPLSFKKTYKEYEQIISEIKEENKDRIEWLEIDVEGMVINVRVEERIINNYDKEYNTCHIVAKNSGIITNILTEKGVSLVHQNDFVNKGNILISGEIKLNEEIKNNVCANGKVYAEVWYNVSTTLPLLYTEENKTGKMRYNFMIKKGNNETKILKSRVNNAETKNIRLFSFFGIEFFIQKEYEIEKIEKTYTNEEALKKAVEITKEKLAVKLDNFEEVITEKVLQKNINNGNLYIDMFVAIKEQIGVRQYYKVEMDSGTNDETNINNTQ